MPPVTAHHRASSASGERQWHSGAVTPITAIVEWGLLLALGGDQADMAPSGEFVVGVRESLDPPHRRGYTTRPGGAAAFCAILRASSIAYAPLVWSRTTLWRCGSIVFYTISTRIPPPCAVRRVAH